MSAGPSRGVHRRPSMGPDGLAWAVALLLSLTGRPALAADAGHPHRHQGVAPKVDKPVPTTLTAEEQATLASGLPVRRQVRYESTEGGRGISIMDVKASSGRIWSVILDFSAYPGWVENLESCTPYARVGDHIFVDFVLSAAGISIEYYVDHTFRPDEGTLTWHLDYSRASDLDDTTGYWLVYDAPGHEGYTRVEYSVDVRIAGWVPGFVEGMLAKKGLETATGWVKRQSEY